MPEPDERPPQTLSRTAIKLAALAGILTLALNVPAFGGQSLAQRVSRLARAQHRTDQRLNAVRALALLTSHEIDGLKVTRTIVTAEGATDALAFAASAEVACPPGSEATGGGASFGDTRNGDIISASYPTLGGRGWQASGRRPNGVPGVLTVYAICAQQG